MRRPEHIYFLQQRLHTLESCDNRYETCECTQRREKNEPSGPLYGQILRVARALLSNIVYSALCRWPVKSPRGASALASGPHRPPLAPFAFAASCGLHIIYLFALAGTHTRMHCTARHIPPDTSTPKFFGTWQVGLHGSSQSKSTRSLTLSADCTPECPTSGPHTPSMQARASRCQHW